MGASEFEWGALPESLKVIRENINEYIYLDIPIKNKVITVFCKNSQKTDIKIYLTELANNEMRLQEYSTFDLYINDDKYFKRDINFWWDIQNHLMFWVKDIEFEKKFKKVIITKPL